MQLPLPLAVYSVCTEDAYLKPGNQDEVKELRSHGFGLITVGKGNAAERAIACIPLIQHIPRAQFMEDLDELPKKVARASSGVLRQVSQQCRVSGVRDVGDVLEGAIHSASWGKGLQKKMDREYQSER